MRGRLLDEHYHHFSVRTIAARDGQSRTKSFAGAIRSTDRDHYAGGHGAARNHDRVGTTRDLGGAVAAAGHGDVVGGVDPSNPDCPEILIAGFVSPGQRRETGAFMTAKTCEYHDHAMMGVPAFQGRIIIR